MKKIIMEQELAKEKSETNGTFLEILCDIFKVNTSDGLSALIKKENIFKQNLLELKEAIENDFVRKEDALKEL